MAWKVFNSDNFSIEERNAQLTFAETPQMKINSFKTKISISYKLDKTYVTFVNRTCNFIKKLYLQSL